MSDQLPVKAILAEIEKEDPTVLRAFVAEYYFFKKDFRKSVDLFAELFSDPDLSPAIKQSVRNFLIIGNTELRKKELETLDFEITVNYIGVGTETINKASFAGKMIEVGKLLELINYHIKGNQETEKT
jgi:hypothetical protein